MYSLLAACLISFFLVILLTPVWIRRAHKKGLVGKDMNKTDGRKVAESGGVIVFLAFLVGIIILAGEKFLVQQYTDAIALMISLFSISLIVLIAYLDDISGWKKGFTRWKKPLITAAAVIPIIPFLLDRNTLTILGHTLTMPYLLYPLILVPIGFVIATNATNLLGGFNGLETGLGIVGFSALLWFAWDTPFAYFIAVGIACMLAFLWFNKYPSKVFPGDTLTYFIGGTFAIVAVFGYFQTITILIMAPYILEGIIKAREIPYIMKHKKTFKPECFGKVQKDGTLKEPYKEIWSTTHIAMKLIRKVKGKCTENDVTMLMVGVYALWCLFVILIFG